VPPTRRSRRARSSLCVYVPSSARGSFVSHQDGWSLVPTRPELHQCHPIASLPAVRRSTAQLGAIAGEGEGYQGSLWGGSLPIWVGLKRVLVIDSRSFGCRVLMRVVVSGRAF
jgi:hypothetical protein